MGDGVAVRERKDAWIFDAWISDFRKWLDYGTRHDRKFRRSHLEGNIHCVDLEFTREIPGRDTDIAAS